MYLCGNLIIEISKKLLTVMISESCSCYVVGFCPNEEFAVNGATIQCPHSHIALEKDHYASQNRGFPFEKDVLNRFNSIISDVNKKVEIHKQIIYNGKVDSELYQAILSCQRLIDIKKFESFNFDNLHSLLIIHGKLIKSINNDEGMHKYYVCQNCSTFSESETCDHIFCKKYAALRNITNNLEKKIKQIGF